jgi:hypothetical protein
MVSFGSALYSRVGYIDPVCRFEMKTGAMSMAPVPEMINTEVC